MKILTFLLALIVLSSLCFAQSPLKLLNKDQLQIIKKYGNPDVDDYEKLAGWKMHYWIYKNIPDKESNTKLSFDSFGSVFLIRIQWDLKPENVAKIWKKYYKEYSAQHLLQSKESDSVATFKYMGPSGGRLQLSKTDSHVVVELINRE